MKPRSRSAARRSSSRSSFSSRTRLGHETLEARLPLTADLAFSGALADQTIVEGDTFDVSFEFTDSATVVGGETVGLNPDDYASLGVFDPAATTTSIVFDTDTLTVTGFAGSGVFQTENAGYDDYQVAVFTFDSFDLDLGQTITAVGSRPLVILSQSDISIGGVIDVSASGRIAGVGGGDGGMITGNTTTQIVTQAEPSLGADDDWLGGGGLTLKRTNIGANYAGGGGGFGGAGGDADNNIFPTFGGFAHGDLSVALQGGGGGGAGARQPSSLQTFVGGGGGGGIELGAVGAITVESTGQVLANGADGASIGTIDASGAGGAGGGILIHGFDVTVNGQLSANGGHASAVNDGSRSGGGGGGQILIARDQSGVYDLSGATITVNAGLAGAGVSPVGSANGQDGNVGVFTEVELLSSTGADTYTYMIELLDSSGGLLETLVPSTTVTGLVTTGSLVTGMVEELNLDSMLGYLADDASLQVRVTVSDSQSTPNVVTDTFDLTVANDNPNSVVVTSTATIDENGTATLDVSFADAGVVDEHTVTVNWGDGVIDTYTLSVGDRAGQFTHQYLDDGPSGTPSFDYNIVVSVNDDDGGGDSSNTDTTVNNVAPVIDSLTTTSSTFGGAEQGEVVNLSASFTDVGTLDSHTAVIDWGDGTTTAATVDQLADTLSGSHVYAQGGFYDVTVTLTDDDTGEATSTTQTVIAGVGVQDGVLVAVGTNGNDVFEVLPHWCSDDLIVLYRLNGGSLALEAFSGPFTGIEMYLGGGSDIGSVSSRVRVDAYIDGGDGSDLLIGGKGDDILLGGAGFDTLYGGAGRDLLIGGDDSDLILGDGGEDILISGTTAHDSNRAALDLIMAEWTSSRSYSQRVDNLMGDMDLSMDGANGEVYLIADGPDATVFDDESLDLLLGGGSKDLYFSGDDDITLAAFNEVVAELEA